MIRADPVPASREGVSPSPLQCRVARALLGLDQADVAALAGLSCESVTRHETERRPLRVAGLSALRRAFERLDVRMLDGRRAGAALARTATPGDGAGLVCPARCRAARAGLRLTQVELAALAGVDPGTIVRFEAGQGAPHGPTLRRLRLALETAGAELLETGGRGVLIDASAIRDASRRSSRARTGVSSLETIIHATTSRGFGG